jgi:zinc transport system substrate-binding protein
MKKKIISGVLALMTGILLIGCGANTQTTSDNA